MNKAMKAYLLKDSGTVFTDKSIIANAKDEDFMEVTLVIPMQEIKSWNEEIEMLGLDEDEEEDF